MTEGQHSHDELRAEIDALKAAIAETAVVEDAVATDAAQQAAQAVQAAEAAVVEGAVTRSDFEAFRDEMRAAVAEMKAPPSVETTVADLPPAEPSGIPAAPADLPAPPAGEALGEGEPQEAPAPESTGRQKPPTRKKKSVWWD